jgi:hypothetical protein
MNIQLKIIALYKDKLNYYSLMLEHESGIWFKSEAIEKIQQISKRYNVSIYKLKKLIK